MAGGAPAHSFGTETQPPWRSLSKILVLYASTHGHTGRIAARIGAALEKEAVAVELHDVRAGGAQPAPLHL